MAGGRGAHAADLPCFLVNRGGFGGVSAADFGAWRGLWGRGWVRKRGLNWVWKVIVFDEKCRGLCGYNTFLKFPLALHPQNMV